MSTSETVHKDSNEGPIFGLLKAAAFEKSRYDLELIKAEISQEVGGKIIARVKELSEKKLSGETLEGGQEAMVLEIPNLVKEGEHSQDSILAEFLQSGVLQQVVELLKHDKITAQIVRSPNDEPKKGVQVMLWQKRVPDDQNPNRTKIQFFARMVPEKDQSEKEGGPVSGTRRRFWQLFTK